MILKGSVSINGTYHRELATKVLPGDDVRVHGRSVHAIASRTLLLNKPAGYTTTRSDRHAERTIFDLLPSDTGHLFHVGRLDKIRVMLGQLGFKVQRLVRIRLGPLTLRGVKPGSYRDLRKEDLESLRKALAAPKPKKERPKPLPKPKAIKFSRFTVIPASAKTGSVSEKNDHTTGRPPAKRPRKTSPTGRRLRKGA